MPRIFDFGGRDVERAQTVAGLRALKSMGTQAAQVTAETADEAAAAEAAGVEMVVCAPPTSDECARARGAFS
jgi:3-methyl-2-oxobutanoate hydroxymethyltransferase